MGDVQHAGSPHAGIIIVANRGLRDLLPCKLLPLALKLCLGSI
jgi:hypothetical protein